MTDTRGAYTPPLLSSLCQSLRGEEGVKPLLEKDPNLKRWFFNNTKGSVIVAEAYLRRLGFFCLQSNISPAAYAKLPKRKMEEMVFDYLQEMETGINQVREEICSKLHRVQSWAEMEQEEVRDDHQDCRFYKEADAGK
jgi:hypothetical protein